MFSSSLRRTSALDLRGFGPLQVLVRASAALCLAIALAGPAQAAGAPQLVSRIQTWNSDGIRNDVQSSLRVSPTLSYFPADDGDTGQELWKTDGTATGTQLVKDINPGPAWSEPQNFAAVGSELYFSADDGVHGRELWKSNGTAAGTTRVTDLVTGATGSEPTYLIAGGGKLYFEASKTGLAGRRLFSYDGAVHQLGYARGPFGYLAGKLYYMGSTSGVYPYTLFRSDGTTAGTEYDAAPKFYEFVSPLVPMAVLGTNLYFGASDAANHFYMWRTDGGAGLAHVVLDHNSQPVDQAINLTTVGTKLFFDSYDGSTWVPWVSDGTPTGTGLLGALTPTAYQPYTPTGFTALGGSVYFLAGDGVHGEGLWKTNGTVGDVHKVKFPGVSTQNYIWNMVAAKGRLYFSFDDLNAEKHGLWISDGTAAGTKPLNDLGPSGSAGLSWVRSTAGAKPSLLMFAGDAAHGTELWSSDGTAAGTKLLRDINTHKVSADPVNLTAYKGALYFSAERAGKKALLWKSNGTAAGTTLVKELAPGVTGPHSFTVVGSMLYFVAHNGKGWNLWKSDGTPAGTVIVKDLQPGNADGFDPPVLVGLNGKVYFFASDGIKGAELWVSNGTAAGTKRVTDINPGAGDAFYSGSRLAVAGGFLYFAADSPARGVELWKSTGVVGNATPLTNIAAGASSAYPTEITPDGNAVFFTATSDGSGYGVYRWDSSLHIIKAPAPSSYPGSLAMVGTRLYFNGYVSESDQQIWTTTGNAAATRFTVPSNPTSVPHSFTALGTDVYFVADDGTNGAELWRTDGVDGTSAHTTMVDDINPSGSSNPDGLTAVNGVLYFAADDGTHGAEPWRTTATAPELVFDINPNDRSLDYGVKFVKVGTNLFFAAASWQSSFELWKIPGV